MKKIIKLGISTLSGIGLVTSGIGLTVANPINSIDDITSLASLASGAAGSLGADSLAVSSVAAPGLLPSLLPSASLGSYGSLVSPLFPSLAGVLDSYSSLTFPFTGSAYSLVGSTAKVGMDSLFNTVAGEMIIPFTSMINTASLAFASLSGNSFLVPSLAFSLSSMDMVAPLSFANSLINSFVDFGALIPVSNLSIFPATQVPSITSFAASTPVLPSLAATEGSFFAPSLAVGSSQTLAPSTVASLIPAATTVLAGALDSLSSTASAVLTSFNSI